MHRKFLPLVRGSLVSLTIVLLTVLLTWPAAQAKEILPSNPTGQPERIGQEKVQQPRRPDSLIVESLSASLTPPDLAASLVGEGITISNVTYTGVNVAAGFFTGGEGIIGFDTGVILSSGSVHDVVGPNAFDNISTINNVVGDSDLTSLSGFPTNDASILEFDFVPNTDTVFFRYVFASDEYNEFVNSKYNDVFAFFVNGSNCATVGSDPISINTINYGNPYTTSPNSHPELYLNNDLNDGGGSIDIEMDGVTRVLTCTATVTANATNHMKLAIADATDYVYDSAVFLEAESLTGERVLELTGVEVTQAIQNLENAVVMVEDKATYVRAHVRSNSTTLFDVKARLIGRRGGQTLPGSPLAPSNPGGRINVLTSPNRAVLNDSFYFALPASWLEGTLDLEFVGITHQPDCLDHANNDNDCQAQVTFQETSVPEVRLVGLRWTDGGGTLHDPGPDDYADVVANIEAQYPISHLNWDNPIELTVPGNPPDLNTVLLTVNNQRTMDGSTRIYYGLLIDHVSGALGLGYVPGSASVGYLRAVDPTTAAHELAHNFGRNHTRCTGSEGGADPAYPYANGWLSPVLTGDNAFFGFNVISPQVFGANNGDLLGYCRPRWVSDHTYTHLRTAILGRWPVVERSQAVASAGEPVVLVSGRLTPENSGSLASIFQLPAPTDIVTPPPGPFTIRFEGAGGAVLASYPFAPQQVEDGEAEAMFSFLLPWNMATTKIVLLYGTTVLDERSASGPTPIVTLTAPSPGALWQGESATVSWTASAANLDFAVQYSPDGGTTWLTLVAGLKTSSYDVSLDSLPGSNNARLRVLASNGFATGLDEIDGAFTVTDHAPTPVISSPVTGSIYVAEQTISLNGSGYDPEDGLLGDFALSWSSDVDGPLGAGQTLEVAAASLSIGLHTITLTATDSDLNIGQATITIEVLAEDSELPKLLEVTPDSAILFPAAETLQVTIRNLGDGTIEWSGSSNVSWITLSEVSGFTPADITLTADPTGLPPGVYNAQVTITGTEATNSPQTIAVELNVLNYSSPIIFIPIVRN